VNRLGKGQQKARFNEPFFASYPNNDFSVFDTLDEACASIESLVPLQSDTSDLKALGIDPVKIPNTVQLTHADVVRYFVSASMLTKEDLDPGIVACL
jgi:hypothetical protein